MDGPELSVLVATRDRAEDLEKMLASLAGEWDQIGEVVVVDNGSSDRTPEVLERRAGEQPKLKRLQLEQPGQSRALNLAIEHSRYAAVAFLDDDVLVLPGWAAAMREAFGTLDYPGFQGRVRLPEEVRNDPDKMALYKRYRTLPVVDFGSGFCERKTITGANMAVRREVLERVGPFDVRLGPGATGFGGDTELADRIRGEGRPFAYVAGAEVVHAFDASRLTEASFEQYYRKLGASRMVLRRRGVGRILPNLVSRLAQSKLARLVGDERGMYHHLGRYYAYSEMLRMSRERSD